MQKLNFATKVVVPTRPRATASTAGAEKRAEVLAEINAHKVQINFREFAKTPAERDALKLAKLQWRATGNKIS